MYVLLVALSKGAISHPLSIFSLPLLCVQVSVAPPHVVDVHLTYDGGISDQLHLPVWLERPVPARVRHLRWVPVGDPERFLGHSNVFDGDGPMPPAGSIQFNHNHRRTERWR